MRLIAFDFNTKQDRPIELSDLSSRPVQGLYHWVVLDSGDEPGGRDALEKLGIRPTVAESFLGQQQEARYDLYDDATHVSVSEAWLDQGELKSGIMDVLLGAHFMVIRTARPSAVLEQVRSIYHKDFQSFARSPGFLLYELASQLFELYRRTYHSFTNEVENVQLTLFGRVTDDIFMSVSRLTTDILAFRRIVLTARDLFKDLATRKSAFVSETTQPSLDIMADRMGRLCSDLDSERSVLTETLNLYMGMVSHRTNRVINRLTIISMIFLPLSFICGVYGMNFEGMPELGWRYSYLLFWFGSAVFVTLFLALVKRKKWI